MHTEGATSTSHATGWKDSLERAPEILRCATANIAHGQGRCTLQSDQPAHSSLVLQIEEGCLENGVSKTRVLIGEVAYFFEAILSDKTEGLAMVSICPSPDPEILQRSKKTLWVTRITPGENLRCIPVTSVVSVVSLLPFPEHPGKFFLFDDLGLDVTYLDSSLFLGAAEDQEIDF